MWYSNYIMKRNENYYICKIEQEDFLIPFAQAVADYPHSIRLNSTGLYLWNILSESLSEEEIFADAIRYFNPSNEEIRCLKEDIHSFISSLCSMGLVIMDSKDITPAPQTSFIKIAGINIGTNLDKNYLDPKLLSFLNTSSSDDIDLYVEVRSTPAFPKTNGTVILRDTSAIIMKTESYFIYILPGYSRIKEMHISIDHKHVIIYSNGITDDTFIQEFYIALRTPFLYSALSKNMIMLHSASILYNDKLYCFSAPSGTGKSTHTALWAREYNIPTINGDLNMLSFSHGKAFVHGTPWCGTSNLYSTDTYELGGIFFLQRSLVNKTRVLDKQSSIIHLVSRIISPTWTEDLSNRIVILSSQLSTMCPYWSLECSISNEAVIVAKTAIDEYKPPS